MKTPLEILNLLSVNIDSITEKQLDEITNIKDGLLDKYRIKTLGNKILIIKKIKNEKDEIFLEIHSNDFTFDYRSFPDVKTNYSISFAHDPLILNIKEVNELLDALSKFKINKRNATDINEIF